MHSNRFLLVNPFCPLSENPSPPLGIAYLAAALEAAGVTVKVLDFVVSPYSRGFLQSALKAFAPRFVGVTAVSMTVDHAFTIVRDVKAVNPGIITAMGGPHVTFLTDASLKACPQLDVIALGEAEETIVELAAAGGDRTAWERIRGLAFRMGDAVHSTGKRAFIRDVNSLPMPARRLLPLGRYRTLNMPVSMTTSRGCPHKCIFCVGRKMVGRKVRYRHPRHVVDEMGQLAEFGFPQINIADDLFTANKQHCLAICNRIIERGLEIKWSAFSRVDTVSPELLRQMKRAGCATVGFGVESADAGILARAKKGITLEQVMAAIHMCREVGITAAVSFILGLPGETGETLRKTTAFGETLGNLGVLYGFHLLAPFPGTDVRLKSDRYRLKILTDDWRRYNANRAISETAGAGSEALNRIVIDWEKKIEAWYSELRRGLAAGTPLDDQSTHIMNLDRIQILYDLMMRREIEEKGTWLNGAGPVSAATAIMTLAEKIEPHNPPQRNNISAALSHAFDHGSLGYTHTAGQVQWKWIDYL